MESVVITIQVLFVFKVQSVSADRTITGQLESIGLRPSFGAKFEKHGYELPAHLFGKPASQLSDLTRGKR